MLVQSCLEIARLNQEHATNELNFKALKKKIIATEELTVLEAQLMNALEEMEPVKKAKKELEAALGKKDEEIERLQIKLDSAESLNNQYEMRLATIELTHRNADDAVSDSKKKMNALEQGKKKLLGRIKKLKDENKQAKLEATQSKRAVNRLEGRLKKTEVLLSQCLQMLADNGLMAASKAKRALARVGRLDKKVDSEGDSDEYSDMDSDLTDTEETPAAKSK
nr:hypothetical protein BaRGS_019760 [Batillaria attramentaria]